MLKMASIMLVCAFILAGCSKDDKDYALANHTHTGTYYQTYRNKLNDITLNNGIGTATLSSGAVNTGWTGEIQEGANVLVYNCTEINPTRWTQLPYCVNVSGIILNYRVEICENGYLYFHLDRFDGNTFTQSLTLGTMMVVIIPHELEVTMKSKGIDLSKYEEVARYCNLPADDVASLNVAIPE